jgi:hypothetical protein
MTIFFRSLCVWRRLTPLILACICAAVSVSFAQAQIEEAVSTAAPPPSASFEFSTITGSGDTITATWVPVVDSSGTTTYKNITLLFHVDSSGNLTVAPGYPKVIPSPPPLVSSFRVGTYTGPGSMSNYIITVSGPGVTTGGATEWSLAAASGTPYYSYPVSATWYVGPIASNPLAARLKAAGITSTAWSYGLGGSSCGCPEWQANTLIGVSQTGNALTIVSFTSNGDHPEPIEEITYTLKP